MARPKERELKVTKEMLECIIENPYRMSWAAIGRKFHVDHTTILYYVKKLRKAGFVIHGYGKNWSAPSDKLIEQIKQENKYAH